MEYKLEYNYLRRMLNVIGREFIEDLKRELIAKDKVATGDLVSSLGYVVNVTEDGNYSIDIISKPYLKYVDGGRRPGKMPPIKAIIPWIEAKGIKFINKKGNAIPKESAAFIIARSIGEKGIKPTNVVKEAQTALFAKYENQIRLAIGEDFKDYMKKMFSDI